jgi:hypothetical protein
LSLRLVFGAGWNQVKGSGQECPLHTDTPTEAIRIG